ncbi:MAG: 2-amino-4-hydroxy-6-hydroxymethyldihydropteridine diphosphokinase [Dehalococcoidia bacterium]
MPIYLGLGSNIGNRAGNIAMALRYLEPLARATRVSTMYETRPEGVSDQPAFYNSVAEVVTGLQPESLLRHLKNIEYEIGRRPGEQRWGPRPIDLDLLLYEEVAMETEFLTLPHPRLRERAFVLVPLAELAPDLVPPGSNDTVSMLLAGLDARSVGPVPPQTAKRIEMTTGIAGFKL